MVCHYCSTCLFLLGQYRLLCRWTSPEKITGGGSQVVNFKLCFARSLLSCNYTNSVNGVYWARQVWPHVLYVLLVGSNIDKVDARNNFTKPSPTRLVVNCNDCDFSAYNFKLFVQNYSAASPRTSSTVSDMWVNQLNHGRYLPSKNQLHQFILRGHSYYYWQYWNGSGIGEVCAFFLFLDRYYSKPFWSRLNMFLTETWNLFEG